MRLVDPGWDNVSGWSDMSTRGLLFSELELYKFNLLC